MGGGREVSSTGSHECTSTEGEQGNVCTDLVEQVVYGPLPRNEDQVTEQTVCVSNGPHTESGLDYGNQEVMATRIRGRASQ